MARLFSLLLLIQSVNTQSTYSFCDVCNCQPGLNGLVICNRLPSASVILHAMKVGNMTLLLQCECPTYGLYKKKVDALFFRVTHSLDELYNTPERDVVFNEDIPQSTKSTTNISSNEDTHHTNPELSKV